MMKQPVYLYSDGACKGNPGPGGWGVLLRYGQHQKELMGHEGYTTNNRMELMAVIQGLRALKRPCNVTVVTDSRYVEQGMTTWLPGWKKKNWRTASGKPVANRDLWEELDTLVNKHQLSWQWVKGHDGHPENEKADALANEAIKLLKSNSLKSNLLKS